MKPIKLSLQAFGPFSGVEVVDFTLLGENPLFLINGPTGAGKSSILDAICFALYGQTTGDEREAAQMRCDHAEDELLTEVTLDFDLGDQSYRIRRAPTQERPKSRGEGTTTQQAEAQLWILDDSPEGTLIVAKSVTDAIKEIKTRIGLDVEQFRQVMVLPQGKFRELLMADSREREKIFGQLFQTQIYKRIEDQLKSKAARIRHTVEQHQNQIKGILQGAGVNSEAEVGSEFEQLQPEMEDAFQSKEKANENLLGANRIKEQAQALLLRFDSLSQKEEEFSEKEKLEPAITGKQQSLACALKAQKIRHIHDKQQSQLEELKSLKEQLATSAEELEVAEIEHLTSESTLKAAKESAEEVDDLYKQKIELRQYEERISELTKAISELTLKEKNANVNKETFDSKKAVQLELIKEQDAKESKISELNIAIELLAPKQIELEAQYLKLEKRKKLEMMRNNHNELQQEENEKVKEFNIKKAEFEIAQNCAKKTEINWHLGQAALLSRELQDNEPCPVCGSMEHPSPAHSEYEGGLVTNQQVDEARDEENGAREFMQTAKELLDGARNALKNSQKEIDQLVKDLGALAENALDVMTETFNSINDEVITLTQQKATQKSIIKRVSEIKSQLSIMVKESSALEKQVKEDANEVLVASSKVDHLEAQLPEGYREQEALSKALDDLSKRIKSLRIAKESSEKDLAEKRSNLDKMTAKVEGQNNQLAKVEENCEEADSAWGQALNESDFENVELFQQSLLPQEEQETLGKAIEIYHSEIDKLKGALKQLKTELADQEKPDMTKIEQQVANNDAFFKVADDKWRKLEARSNQLQDIQDKLTKAHEKNAELEAEYAIYGTLSDVANGQTGNKVSLQRFVLSVLLDDVLIQASYRLNLMSKGRYQLVRKKDRAKGNKASGLEMEVEDGYTGKTRSVATLSGGESFMAALSLALGLSDVVQAYAGGIRLDALFIDEGFGSLDSESLDLAIKTLIDLQATGRMIGIISHVSELKEQMALRLDVISSHRGSVVKTIAA